MKEDLSINPHLKMRSIVKFKKLHPDAILPSHSKDGDAGLDLTAVKIENAKDYQTKHSYGLAVEIPAGYVGMVFPRSSVCKHNARLSNSVGVIDSGYRGEITAVFDRYHSALLEYNKGDRTAQLVIVPYVSVQSEWAESLSETERGEGGYGSSGK
jgi:dUTP pyrophosphatase